MRGYGATDAPARVEAYDVPSLTGDVVALLDALGAERALVVGHDTAPTSRGARRCSTRSACAPSPASARPYFPRSPEPPLELMRRYLGDDFYFVWFQEPGVADAALAKDVRRTLATREVWDAAWAQRARRAADAALHERGGPRGLRRGVRADRLHRRPQLVPQHRPQLAASLEPFEGRTIDQPALFITGSRDPVTRFAPASMRWTAT